ncbi:MAG: Hpt domain-containing protein [Rhodobacterales bacterium]|nr:Hpt domain-containing protein [Rhodobacterales bacterium]
MSDTDKPEIITPPNALKAKVKVGGAGAVDMAVLEQAEQVIASMADDYLDWVAQDLKNLRAAYETLRADPNNAENLERIFQISHDIKGQGGSFGFRLITQAGNSLCRFIESLANQETLTSAHLDAVGVHVDTMTLIIAEDLRDDGGAKGGALMSGLNKMVEKLSG